MTTTVVASETLWLDPLDPAGPRERFDHDALVEQGLSLIELEEGELALFVELARVLDDGEASVIAVAAHRRLQVATDDRKALRLASSQSPPIETVRTTELVKQWANSSASNERLVGKVLRSIAKRSNYTPRRDDPEFGWWMSAIDA